MNGLAPLSRISEVAGEAGEWAHYSGAIWVAFSSGGVELAGIYLIAVTIPGAIYRSGRSTPAFLRRLGGLASPAGLVALWGLSSVGEVPPLYVVTLALSIGGGAALAGRPVAFSGTLNSGPGLGAVAGSVAALGLAVRGDLEDALALGAALTFVSSVISTGEFASARMAAPALLRATQLALAFIVGMRIVEPVIIRESARIFDPEPVASSLFSVAWVIGAAIGWKAAPRLDARVVLSAPFVAAAALAALSTVSGPAMATLWGIVGSCAGTLGGSGFAETSESSLWPRGRLILLPSTFLGTLFTAWWLGKEGGFEFATGTAAAILIASGFIGLAAARRVRIPRPLASSAPASDAISSTTIRVIGLPGAVVPHSEAPSGVASELLTVVAELRDALQRSRSIRRQALAVYQAVSQSGSNDARAKTLDVVETSLTSAEQAKRRIAELSISI